MHLKKVEADSVENGKGEEFRVAVWLGVGQVTERLQTRFEYILQAATGELDRKQTQCKTSSIIYSKINLFL